VAATERERVAEDSEGQGAGRSGAFGSIVAAAMLLPGVLASGAAQAQSKPDAAVASLRNLSYQDSQPGLERITVQSPSFQLVLPVGEDWVLEGTLVSDSVSGATPRYHASVSGASYMTEERRAGDLKVTRYFRRTSVALSVAGSTERDYGSLAGALELRLSSEDQNTTWLLSLGGSNDRIDPVNDVVNNEKRRTQQVALGVTQAATRADLWQLLLAYSDGRGYYSDPYRVLDERPRARRQNTLLLRWNHHFDDGGSTLRTSYRAYVDSFGIQAHAVQAEWVAPIGAAVKVTPSLRLYTQSAADFYAEAVYDPALGEPFPVGYNRNNPPGTISLDQRLSSFGAVTLGLGIAFKVDTDWTIDGRFEAYEQRGRWAWDGNGSIGLPPLRARSLQLGISRRF
jgi:hypothetical protein